MDGEESNTSHVGACVTLFVYTVVLLYGSYRAVILFTRNDTFVQKTTQVGRYTTFDKFTPEELDFMLAFGISWHETGTYD